MLPPFSVPYTLYWCLLQGSCLVTIGVKALFKSRNSKLFKTDTSNFSACRLVPVQKRKWSLCSDAVNEMIRAGQFFIKVRSWVNYIQRELFHTVVFDNNILRFVVSLPNTQNRLLMCNLQSCVKVLNLQTLFLPRRLSPQFLSGTIIDGRIALRIMKLL